MDLTKIDIISVLGLFLLIFVIIFILALLTPKIAAAIDKFVARYFKKEKSDKNDDIYKVRSIYDAPLKENTEENNKDGEIKNGEE